MKTRWKAVPRNLSISLQVGFSFTWSPFENQNLKGIMQISVILNNYFYFFLRQLDLMKTTGLGIFIHFVASRMWFSKRSL